MIRALAALILSAVAAEAACREDSVDLRGEWGAARFGVDLADDPAERAQGLMNVPEMAATRGMLFVYETPQRATFWMKDTLIPLDMIFIGPDGVVTNVHAEAVPHDTTIIDGGDGVIAVLEVNGGQAARLGIAEGSEVRHPALDQSMAAWPCE